MGLIFVLFRMRILHAEQKFEQSKIRVNLHEISIHSHLLLA